jgi:hypothetical protein
MALHYLIGDATEPILKPALICHVVNDVDAWGSGFVVALSKKSRAPEICYHKFNASEKKRGIPIRLGMTQITSFLPDIQVANMYCQHGIRPVAGTPALDYDALQKCLTTVSRHAERAKATLHMPRIGAVRSGGSWPEIEKIILETMTVETYVYTLPFEKSQWPTVYENDTGTPAPDPVADVDLSSLFK